MTRLFYIRNDEMAPQAAVAFNTSVETDGTYVTYAISIRNPMDRFDRRMGREIASARLLAGVGTSKEYLRGKVKLVLPPTQVTIQRAIISAILERGGIPRRILRALQKRYTPLAG